jgi:hypothetical protein
MAERHQTEFKKSDFELNWTDLDENCDDLVTENELYCYMLKKARADGQIKESSA